MATLVAMCGQLLSQGPQPIWVLVVCDRDLELSQLDSELLAQVALHGLLHQLRENRGCFVSPNSADLQKNSAPLMGGDGEMHDWSWVVVGGMWLGEPSWVMVNPNFFSTVLFENFHLFR